jgi:hypothetical protein
MSKPRPGGITALDAFFMAGAIISFTSCGSLVFLGSFLEPMWRINSRAHEAFDGMGAWAIVLLSIVCIAYALSAVRLWSGTRWGLGLVITLITINLLGDVVNVALGAEPKAAFGLPIAAAILAYLMSARVRRYFDRSNLPRGRML